MNTIRNKIKNYSVVTVLGICFQICFVFNIFGQTITFNSASTTPANTASPKIYEVFEIRFDIANYDSANRFNACRVEVYAEVTTPSATIEKMPAFYKKDSSPNWAVRYAPRQQGSFSYKLVIKQKAANCTTVTSTVTSATLNFTTQTIPLNSGFMQVDAGAIPSSKRFKTSNGNAFVINGQNAPWSDCRTTLGGTFGCNPALSANWDLQSPGVYTTVFNAMQTNKMNFARVFVNQKWDALAPEYSSANNPNVNRGIQLTYNGLNNYNLDNSLRLDDLVQNAQTRGIYMAFVLRDHLEFKVRQYNCSSGNFVVSNYDGWQVNAYNSANAGGILPLKNHVVTIPAQTWCGPNAIPPASVNNPTDFLTAAPSRDAFKNYIRYLYARYGAFTSVGIVEFFNEMDNGGDLGNDIFSQAPNTDFSSWHSTMQTYLSQIDIYSKPTTTSFSWKDHFYTNTNNNIWNSLTSLTARNTHMYNVCGFDPNTKTYNFAACEFPSSQTVDKWLTQINHLKSAGGTNKPAYIGEYGPIGETVTPNTGTQDWFRIRNYFQDGAWVPYFFAEAAGTNLIWAVDNQPYLAYPNIPNTNYWGFVPHTPSADPYKAFGLFLENESANLPLMTFGSCTATVGIGCSGYKKTDRALVLVRDTTANGSFEVNPNSNTSGTVTLSGMTNGNYTVEFWNTLTGTKTTSTATATGGTLNISVPSFSRNVAVKAIFGGGGGGGGCAGETKLALTAANLSVNLTPALPLANLVDNQAAVPTTNPTQAAMNGVAQNLQFIPSWSTSSTNPSEVIINLGGTKCVKSFWYYDAEDQGNVEIYYKNSSNVWVLHQTFDVNQYLVWRPVPFASVSTTQLKLKFTNSPRIGEFAVFVGN